MQDNKLSNIWIGSDISRYNPLIIVNESMLVA